MASQDREPDGQWCWCPDPPGRQTPHDCAEDHAGRPACQADGAHVHPRSGPRRPAADAIRPVLGASETQLLLDGLELAAEQATDPDELHRAVELTAKLKTAAARVWGKSRR